MTEALTIAVVGHTNAGKTSLLRTLTRRVDFGQVSDRPGTTRHAEAVALRLDGREAVRFIDTPGLEDSVALLDFLARQSGDSRPERVRAFLAGLDDARLAADFSYTNTRGQPFTLPLGPVMLHVANHGTHHRGELVAMLAILEVAHPEDDLLRYLQAQVKPAA